jgi:hypothetical protein
MSAAPCLPSSSSSSLRGTGSLANVANSRARRIAVAFEIPIFFKGQTGDRLACMLAASKGAKCLCGKRAKGTLMSRDGERGLLPCCLKCGFIALEYFKRLDLDDHGKAVRLPPEILEWFATDSGKSSKTIASVLVPGLKVAIAEDGPGLPRDPDDFGRCHRLLALIPNGVERLSEVAAAHPEWSRLVAAWPELASLYEEELPSGRAPKLYARIKELTL